MNDVRSPDGLLYHPEHDWLRTDGAEAVFGVTWFAQDAMGEVVYFQPPAVGSVVTAGAPFGELESVKAVSDVIAPASGVVVAVNDALASVPQTINEDPYGAGWLIRVRLSDPAEIESLMDASGYRRYLRGLAGEEGAR